MCLFFVECILNVLVGCLLPFNILLSLFAQAIQLFANARPPGIYKQDYIDELFTFYHERRPETVICPSTPEWKRSSDLDLNGEAVQDEDDDGNGVAPPEVRYSAKHLIDLVILFVCLISCII